MLSLLIAFAVSLGVTLSVVHFARGHQHFFLDHDLSGPQKFHSHPVPRVGGLGIFVGLLCALGLIGLQSSEGLVGLQLMACGLLAFVAGLVEDITKRVSPLKRLLATAA